MSGIASESLLAVLPMIRAIAEVGVAQKEGKPRPGDFDEVWVQSVQIASEYFTGKEVDVFKSVATDTLPLELAINGFEALAVLALKAALVATGTSDDYYLALDLLNTLASNAQTLDTETELG